MDNEIKFLITRTIKKNPYPFFNGEGFFSLELLTV